VVDAALMFKKEKRKNEAGDMNPALCYSNRSTGDAKLFLSGLLNIERFSIYRSTVYTNPICPNMP
jgi:hypothetical protein